MDKKTERCKIGKKTGVLAVLLLLVCLLQGCAGNMTTFPGQKEEAQSRDIFAMDTYMTLTAYGEHAKEAIEAAVNEVYRLDALFSVGNETSDISVLNREQQATVSDETKYLIEQSCKIAQKTNGAFEITIYPLMQLWGFTTELYHVPAQEEREHVLERVNYQYVMQNGNEIKLLQQASIDLGGIAKGYTSSRIMEIFQEHGVKRGIVNLGGNVQCLGKKQNGELWKVAIQNPQKTQESFGTLAIENQAVITSGGYERYFEENGKTYHHILHPQTGEPVEGDILSSTVVSANGTVADAMSTSLFVMGVEQAEDFYRYTDLPIEFVLFSNEQKVYVTEGIVENFVTDYEKIVIKK